MILFSCLILDRGPAVLKNCRAFVLLVGLLLLWVGIYY
jgi:hypothetical protein